MLDALIVGAGLIGSSIAWLLAKSGCSVALIDAGRFGGEASSAAAGMLAPGGEYHRPSLAAQFAIKSLALYPAFVRRLENESGLSIDYRRCGAIDLAYGEEHWCVLQARADMQRRFGISVHELCLSTLNSVAPGLLREQLSGALFYPNEACVAPENLLAALRIACTNSGVRICEKTPAERIEAGADQVVATTPQERTAARYLVLAAGAWSSQIPLSIGGLPASIPESFPVKGHLAGYELAPGSLNPILRHGHNYIVQRKNGFTIAGSCEEYCNFDRSINPKRIAEICETAWSFYSPISQQEPIRQWIGFRPGIEQHRPAIGRVPGTIVWLAYGHYRNGILLTPATAHLISSEILADRKRNEVGRAS
ncbi:MAG TPA: FAD-dependent oxidoreductase [Silvibacterium sp.]|nr:FAD-dependent oxidoreductase [Silvibacterium sp.]